MELELRCHRYTLGTGEGRPGHDPDPKSMFHAGIFYRQFKGGSEEARERRSPERRLQSLLAKRLYGYYRSWQCKRHGY